MRVVYERCCGRDVHKKTVVACVMTPGGQETRTFGTMTQDLLALADWLEQWGVTHVAMESTGVYGKPLFNLLEGTFEVLVVNAHHIKAVPGRKTDLRDAEWIADLLRHGLVRGSYIPDRPQRELWELVRYWRSLIGNRSQIVNRIQKVLEGANIKLASVASNVVGVSGRAMLEAMVGGTEDPRMLAALAKGKLRAKQPALETALQGQMGPHQRLLLASHLRHLDFLEAEIAQLDQGVAARLDPSQEVLERLDEIPGVGRRCAQDGYSRRGGHRHEPIPYGEPPGLLGQGLPWHPRERREAEEHRHRSREQMAAGYSDRSRPGFGAHQRHLSVGPVPSIGGASG
jgi:transposase